MKCFDGRVVLFFIFVREATGPWSPGPVGLPHTNKNTTETNKDKHTHTHTHNTMNTITPSTHDV